MKLPIPAELERRVAAMASCATTQDWIGLAAFFHPDYVGREAGKAPASAADEILVIRDELHRPGVRESECRMVPLAACSRGRDVRSVVEQTLAVRWSGGCQGRTVRRFDQVWRRVAGEWFLVRSEQAPDSATTQHETALLPWVRDRLALAEELLGIIPLPPFTRTLAGLAIRQLRPLIPAARVGVGVEASRIPPWAREALRRATSVALDAWNQSLQGVLELYPHTGVGVPDILIRGWEGPIFAECGGVTLLSALHRCGRRRPRLAEVRVSSIERGNKSALCVNPTDLFFTVGHELGHCFGLGECAHGEGVMAPWLWSEPPPGGPFTAERRAVIRLLEACHSLLSRSHATLGQEELAAANAARAAGLRRQAEREPSPVPLAGYELLEETSYAPPSVRDYWEGDARVRAGDLTGALASYDRVLSCGPPHPVVLLRRGWIHSALGNSEALSDFQAAVAADPSWLTARRYLIHTLKSCGHASEAQWHEARALALTRRAELEEILSHARAYRSPRMACRTLARAAVLGARHVAALVVERAAGGRVPSVKAL